MTTKLMILFSALVMLAVSLTGVSIYLRMQQQFKETQMKSVMELTGITNNYIDQYLFTINNLLVVASESGLLATTNKEELKLFFERQLVLSEDFINSIFFIDDKGEVYGYPQLVLGFLPQDTLGKLYPYDKLSFYGQTEPFDFPVLGKTVTIYRKVWDERKREYIGVLAVNIQPKQILKKIEAYNSAINRSIVLVSHTGKLLGHNRFNSAHGSAVMEEDPYLRRIVDDLSYFEMGEVQEISYNGNPYYSSLSNRNSFAWNVIVMVDQLELHNQYRETRIHFIVYLIGATLISLVIGYIFSIYLSKPILKLVEQMKAVARGDLSQRIQTHQQDEFGFLTRHYNVMLDRITELIQVSVIKENSKREAEMKMYQAQVNPHFLYNTLNSVQWMARMNKPEEVDRAIARLVPLLQYSLNKGTMTTLGEELEQLERYGELQGIRYRGRIGLVLKIDGRVDLKESCPRMIVQPLVENAIYHGLDASPSGGLVGVKVEYIQDGARLRITIIDNGVGMAESKLKALNEGLHEIPDEGRYRGMVNVVQRLHYFWGEAGSIRCWSRSGIGTVIQISWERGIGQDGSAEAPINNSR